MNDLIYYDGKCDFCKKMINFLNLKESFILYDLHEQNPKNNKHTISIPKEKLLKEIHLIKENQEVLSGGDALKWILISKNYINIPKFIDPIALFFFRLIYFVISRNRSFFNFLLNISLQIRKTKTTDFFILIFCWSIIYFIAFGMINHQMKIQIIFGFYFWILSLVFVIYRSFFQMKTYSIFSTIFFSLIFFCYQIYFTINEIINQNQILAIFLVINFQIQRKTQFSFYYKLIGNYLITGIFLFQFGINIPNFFKILPFIIYLPFSNKKIDTDKDMINYADFFNFKIMIFKLITVILLIYIKITLLS